jgi:hypothetical protein
VYVQFALHVPTHFPLHAVPLAVDPSHVPVHVPAQVPSQWTFGCVAVTSHSPVHSAEHDPWQVAATVAEPSHVALAWQLPLHSTLKSPGLQLTVTSGGVQLAVPVHCASQLASRLASTWQPPPVVERKQEACTLWPAARMPWIFVDAWLHASVTWASSPDFAVHVSVTPRSVSIALHALKIDVSIADTSVSKSDAAVRNCLVVPSTLTVAIDADPPANSLHDVSLVTLLTLLQPAESESAATAPARTRPEARRTT